MRTSLRPKKKKKKDGLKWVLKKTRRARRSKDKLIKLGMPDEIMIANMDGILVGIQCIGKYYNNKHITFQRTANIYIYSDHSFSGSDLGDPLAFGFTHLSSLKFCSLARILRKHFICKV